MVTRPADQRGRTVYIDYLQNLHGKTLASVYSAPASEFAGVSTPVQWSELELGIRPQDFTLRTVLTRVCPNGDQWAALHKAGGMELVAVLHRLHQLPGR